MVHVRRPGGSLMFLLRPAHCECLLPPFDSSEQFSTMPIKTVGESWQCPLGLSLSWLIYCNPLSFCNSVLHSR
jgi:hypothetical protein